MTDPRTTLEAVRALTAPSPEVADDVLRCFGWARHASYLSGGRPARSMAPPTPALMGRQPVVRVCGSEEGMNLNVKDTYEQEEKERNDWAADYDGTTCPNCGRIRMMKCNNGKRRCEKCNWDPDANEYSQCPHHAR